MRFGELPGPKQPYLVGMDSHPPQPVPTVYDHRVRFDVVGWLHVVIVIASRVRRRSSVSCNFAMLSGFDARFGVWGC